MNEQGMVLWGDTEPRGRTARGTRLRSLLRLAIPPSPATKLLSVLLVLVVAMWIVSHVSDFNIIVGSDGFAHGTYLLEQRGGVVFVVAERGIVYCTRFRINAPPRWTVRGLIEPDDCAKHLQPGIAYYTGGFSADIVHVHYWLFTMLIAVPLGLLWLRQVLRCRSRSAEALPAAPKNQQSSAGGSL